MPILAAIASFINTIGIYVIRVGLLLFGLAVILAFPWGDITPYLVYIPMIISKLWFFNTFFDMNTFFLLVQFELYIALFLIGKTIVLKLIHFLAGGSMQGAKDDDATNV